MCIKVLTKISIYAILIYRTLQRKDPYHEVYNYCWVGDFFSQLSPFSAEITMTEKIASEIFFWLAVAIYIAIVIYRQRGNGRKGD